MSTETETEATLRRFFTAEVGEIDAPESLPAALTDRAARRRRRQARRHIALAAAAAAAAVVVAIAALVTDDHDTTQVHVNPAGPTTTTSITSTTVPSVDRPPLAVSIKEGRIVVVDTVTRQELRTLYRVPDQRHIVSALTLSSDRGSVHFEVTDSDSGFCHEKHYSVPVTGGRVTDVANFGLNPSFSHDGRFVAFTVDGSTHGGPTGPGYHCRQAIMVRELSTGRETTWAEKPGNDGTAVSNISWTPDGDRIAFERTHPTPEADGQRFVWEIRSLDVHKYGDIETASDVLVTGTGPELEGGQGTGQYLPTSPVWIAQDTLVYVRYDGNTRFGAIMLWNPLAPPRVIVPQRDVELSGITVDRTYGHLLAFYKDEVRAVELNGKVESLLPGYGLTVW